MKVWIRVFLAAVSLFALENDRGAVFASMTVSQKATVMDPAGVLKEVSFTGEVEGSGVMGELMYEGISLTVTATLVGSGSVSGTIRAEDGRVIGTFQGNPVGAEFTGTYSILGASGIWTAPAYASSPAAGVQP